MIHFPFRFDKMCQALGVLLGQSPNRTMNYTKLLKLLYLADREMLQAKGRSITGDSIVAMPNGPVLDTVYGLIKSVSSRFDDDAVPAFRKWIEDAGKYEVRLRADPGTDLLSRAEQRLLENIAARHHETTYSELINLCHGFDEWRWNDPGDSMRPLPVEDVLRAVGRADWIDRVREEAELEEAATHTFGPLSA